MSVTKNKATTLKGLKIKSFLYDTYLSLFLLNNENLKKEIEKDKDFQSLLQLEIKADNYKDIEEELKEKTENLEKKLKQATEERHRKDLKKFINSKEIKIATNYITTVDYIYALSYILLKLRELEVFFQNYSQLAEKANDSLNLSKEYPSFKEELKYHFFNMKQQLTYSFSIYQARELAFNFIISRISNEELIEILKDSEMENVLYNFADVKLSNVLLNVANKNPEKFVEIFDENRNLFKEANILYISAIVEGFAYFLDELADELAKKLANELSGGVEKEKAKEKNSIKEKEFIEELLEKMKLLEKMLIFAMESMSNYIGKNNEEFLENKTKKNIDETILENLGIFVDNICYFLKRYLFILKIIKESIISDKKDKEKNFEFEANKNLEANEQEIKDVTQCPSLVKEILKEKIIKEIEEIINQTTKKVRETVGKSIEFLEKYTKGKNIKNKDDKKVKFFYKVFDKLKDFRNYLDSKNYLNSI